MFAPHVPIAYIVKGKPIYHVAKGDDCDGHFFWRNLIYHFSTSPDDYCEGDSGYAFDIRQLAVEALKTNDNAPGVAPSQMWPGAYIPSEHVQEFLEYAVDQGLIKFPEEQ